MRLAPRGSMLVMAMWALSLLTVFSVSLGFGVRQRAALMSRLATLDAVYPIAYSGVEKAKSLVKADDNFDVDLLTDTWAVASEKVVDEERKLNLNNTRIEIASRLFRSVSGLSGEEADELVYNLLDFMDSDNFFGHPQYGAETSYYESLNRPYKAKDSEYEQIDELLLVKGMTAEVFEKIRPFVTVYGSGKVNLNTAGPEVLSALGLSGAAVKAIVDYRVGGDGQEGTSDDNFFANASTVPDDIERVMGTPLDVSQTVTLSGLVTEGRVGVSSTAFSVRSVATLQRNGASVEVEAVFDRKSNVLYQRAGEVQWPVRT